MGKKKKKKSPKKEKVIKWVPKARDDDRMSKMADKRMKGTLENKVEVSAPPIDPQILLQDILAAIKKGESDPFLKEMAKYAVGDVVGLGLMTQDEFDAEEEFDDAGIKIRQSGRERALDMIPTKIRAQVLCDLTPYFLAKKGTSSSGNMGPKPQVKFFIPENGRPLRSDDE